MYKIGVIGDRDSVYGFAALGLDIFPVKDSAEAASRLHRMAENEYAVIYITEAAATELERDIDRYRASRLPAIILIPGIYGNTGKGMSSVRKSVEQAVGSDIIFGGQG